MTTPTIILTVDVTQDDIDHGTRQSSCGCPVALALKRAGHLYVSVGVATLDLDAQRLRHDTATANFVDEFDRGHGDMLAPFTARFAPRWTEESDPA